MIFLQISEKVILEKFFGRRSFLVSNHFHQKSAEGGGNTPLFTNLLRSLWSDLFEIDLFVVRHGDN